MLQKEIANEVIFEALSLGADFCDLFIEKNQLQNISMNSSKIKDIKTGVDFGIGVRLIYGDKALYGYTNSSEKIDLINLTRKLAEQYKSKVNIENTLKFNTKIPKEIAFLQDSEKKSRPQIHYQ